MRIGAADGDEGLRDVRVTYDPDADAAYLNLVDRDLQPGEAVHQSDLGDTPGGRGTLIADFDRDGRLLGIEVLGARAVLPPELLHGAPPPAEGGGR
jgi:uncharacterized protein YuzE